MESHLFVLFKAPKHPSGFCTIQIHSLPRLKLIIIYFHLAYHLNASLSVISKWNLDNLIMLS